MLDAVRDIRIEDPGIGCYKLWIMLTVLFGAGFMPGRDSFYALLRQHRLMLPAELQPSLPQVEEPNQRTDLDFSQPVVGQRHYLYTTCQW